MPPEKSGLDDDEKGKGRPKVREKKGKNYFWYEKSRILKNTLYCYRIR